MIYRVDEPFPLSRNNEKFENPVLWPWPLTMTMKFNTFRAGVKVHVRTKYHQAKCSGYWVINSVLDFGQLYTLIATISGTDQAIDNRKTALSTTMFSTCGEKKW